LSLFPFYLFSHETVKAPFRFVISIARVEATTSPLTFALYNNGWSAYHQSTADTLTAKLTVATIVIYDQAVPPRISKDEVNGQFRILKITNSFFGGRGASYKQTT
jgi:hypothetical protein